MAETLGDALLYLRTDDREFSQGVAQAHAKARALEGTLDKTTMSSGRLGQELAKTGRAAASAGSQFERTGRAVTMSAGAQRAGMQQLSMQLSDVATMYALGARPMQIFASQSGQVLQAVQLMTGGTSRLAAFLGGPWGMAITTAAIVLTPLIGKLFETDRAMEAVEEAADAMGRAQSVLGQIFDLTTGKIREQNEVLLMNARILAINLRAEAMSRRETARGTLIDAQQTSNVFHAQLGGASVRDAATADARAVSQLLRDIGAGRITREQAIAKAETMDFSGTRVSRNEFIAALRDAAVANLNERVADLIDQSLASGELAAGLRDAPKPTKPKKNTGPTQAEITRRFEDNLDSFRSRMAAAEAQVATSVEERAELELKQVDLAERATIRAIKADKDFSAADKERLTAAAEMAAETERQVIEFRKTQQLERDAQAIAEERNRAAIEALQTELRLAETEADRKRIALQIFDAEEAALRAKLQATKDSETVAEAERERARIALQALEAGSAARRDAVARGNETEVERYLRYLDRTPGQINDAIDGIKIEGLEALNDGLVEAIMGTKSLGEVFHKVSRRIIADLLEIAVQRAVIAPLANMLFPAAAAAGPGNLLAGTPYGGNGGRGLFGLFAGLFAEGGLIPAGSWGIVGERGPEPVIGTSAGAMVLPNSSLQGGGAPVVRVHVVRGEMFEPVVETISGRVSVETVEATSPRLIGAAVQETARQLTRQRI